MSSPSSPVKTTNRPPFNSYIKSHKNISFSYQPDCVSFQHGTLGDSDSYLAGILHLNYPKHQQVKSLCLHLKGVEKTSWYKAQARSKALYMGEQILVDQPYPIWESKEDETSLTNLDIPFKVKLPYNLPETITTEIGSVNYILRATVYRKGGIVSPTTQMIEIQCPLRRTITIDNANYSPYKLRGESRSGLDYTFCLPPNKNFNLGTYVSIPMRIRFLRPGISVERVEISLKTCMDFRCNNPVETRHVKEQSAYLVVPRQEIQYLQPLSHHYEGECVHTINLFLPRSVQPTYSGRFISITHQLCIKFCLWGADMDFQVEESVRVANIHEKFAVEPPPMSPPPQANRNLISPTPTPTTYNEQIASGSQYSSSIYDPDEISIDIRERDKSKAGIGRNGGVLSDRYLYSDRDMLMPNSQPYQHLHDSNVRRPQTPSTAMGELSPPPPFSFHSEGYDKKFLLNNDHHKMNKDRHPYDRDSLIINNNLEEESYHELWLYKQKVEMALLHQQQLYQQKINHNNNIYNNYSRSRNSRSSTPSTSSSDLSFHSLHLSPNVAPTVAPKSPPQPPPTPIPSLPQPIPTPNQYNDVTLSGPSPNSKLPPYISGERSSNNKNNDEKDPIRSTASPPPYRGHAHIHNAHYVEAYTYNFDD